MTETDVIQLLRRYHEELFPRNCPMCNRRFGSLLDFILHTTRLGGAQSFDAEIGRWNTINPIGGLALSRCACGTTLALSTRQMLPAQNRALLQWLKAETTRRGMSDTQVLNDIRDEIRQQVLAESDKAAARAAV